MLLQILQGTPRWVFLLFFILLALGLAQVRPRVVTPARVTILPAALIAYSLFGVINAFGADAAGAAAWAAGLAAAVLLNRSLKQPAGARWDAASGTFRVPGSWVPLGLLMTVFFARYAIAASLAINPALAGSAVFSASASGLYGLLSGTFLARALHVRSQRPAQSVQSP